MYYDGRGVPQDYTKAAKWYRKAAEQGYNISQLKLGLMYHTGQGVPFSYTQAVKWFRKAAEQGDALSQTLLGLMYVKGEGVPQNDVQAHMWLNLAAAQDLKGGAKSRDNVAKKMTPAQLAEAQRLAREWTEKHRQK